MRGEVDMDYCVNKQYFTSEGEARAEIEAAGLHVMVVDVAAEQNALHFHDFDTQFYILEGGLQLVAGDTGATYNVRPGDRVVASAGWVHRETHDGFRAVFGFSVDPATLTMPINKPVMAPL
jgi:quercetin dioxygenase-like cupin family protein